MTKAQTYKIGDQIKLTDINGTPYQYTVVDDMPELDGGVQVETAAGDRFVYDTDQEDF